VKRIDIISLEQYNQNQQIIKKFTIKTQRYYQRSDGDGVTIRDVAKLAGVSAAIVSRYFHGKSVVTDQTSKKIEEAVRTLDYKPVLRYKNPDVIAVLLSSLRLTYFSDVMKVLLEEVPRYGYKIIFIPLTGEDESYKQFFKDLDITGVIYLDEDMDQSILDYIEAKNIQTVMFGGISSDHRPKIIRINDLAAAYEGAKYLLKLNHEKILILSDYQKSITTGFQRITGCRRAFEEFGLFLDDSMIKYADLTYENGYRLTRAAIREGLNFTAIFAFSDEVAMGAITALKEVNKIVPKDVSVLGFDGIGMSRMVTPKLTTIRQPIRLMVEHTLDTFGKRDKERNIEVTLPYRLEEGGTCREHE
jgi:LacI family transcriptional regulator